MMGATITISKEKKIKIGNQHTPCLQYGPLYPALGGGTSGVLATLRLSMKATRLFSWMSKDPSSGLYAPIDGSGVSSKRFVSSLGITTGR